MNALGVMPRTVASGTWTGVDELRRICGYSRCSPDYGLAYGNGQDLETVYNTYGFSVQRQAVSGADLAYLCELGVGQVGGARLYHWMGVRGYDGAVFQLANPAYSYKGIEDDLDPNEWNTWGGWTCVMVIGCAIEGTMQPVALQPVTLGWLLAIIILLLAIIFLIIGLPDPKSSCCSLRVWR